MVSGFVSFDAWLILVCLCFLLVLYSWLFGWCAFRSVFDWLICLCLLIVAVMG